jgi:8-oxo-dGTP pyrophosphatase MutT (NUDIX family)
MFNDKGTEVALILKDHPADQVGLYNGVGGKINGLEESHSAMLREFLEETGLTRLSLVHLPIKLTELWEKTIYLQGPNWQVHYFRAFSTPIIEALKAKTEWPTSEPVHVYRIKDLPENLYSHVAWTIHMSLRPDIRFPLRVDDTRRVE